LARVNRKILRRAAASAETKNLRMITMLKRASRKLVNRILEPSLETAFQRSVRDIGEWRQQNALIETGQFVEQHMPLVRSFPNAFALITYAVSQVNRLEGGLVCEFGVATGKSINHIAGLLPDVTVYGFDSFEGLPEDWQTYYPKGSFKMEALPEVRSNVQLVKGWFRESLPMFLEEHPGQAVFLHVDCDLYSSTKDIFELMATRLRPGSVLVFDEYFNYPGWKEGEHKAFMEFIERTAQSFEYLGYTKANEQVAVKIIAAGAN
jgi:hypothetical protein